MDLNKLGRRTYECALRRGKIHEETLPKNLHSETIKSLTEEMNEVLDADEDEKSEHLNSYSAVVEELTDVLIVALTELYRRGVDINKVVYEKIEYNERR